MVNPSPAVYPLPKIHPPVSAPAAAPVIAVVQAPPSLPKKKFVTREDMEAVFNRGARSLSRIEAVTGLKNRGFGKSAAYAALTPDGRFSIWLKVAPDGIVSWTDGRTK